MCIPPPAPAPTHPPHDALSPLLPCTAMDLPSLHRLLRTQAMLQGRLLPLATTLKLRVPAGILDCTPIPGFTKWRHSFESGTRHLTIDDYITTEDAFQKCVGFTAFTLARAIAVADPAEIPQHKPHIVSVMFDGQTHRIGFNPTTREIEIDARVAWFSSTDGWLGGVKRPGPPIFDRIDARTRAPTPHARVLARDVL